MSIPSIFSSMSARIWADKHDHNMRNISQVVNSKYRRRACRYRIFMLSVWRMPPSAYSGEEMMPLRQTLLRFTDSTTVSTSAVWPLCCTSLNRTVSTPRVSLFSYKQVSIINIPSIPVKSEYSPRRQKQNALAASLTFFDNSLRFSIDISINSRQIKHFFTIFFYLLPLPPRWRRTGS